MENSYEILRKNYRDVIQNILDSIDKKEINDSVNIKKHISKIYCSKNIKKSIDFEFKDYVSGLYKNNNKMSIHDKYWSDYNFQDDFYETDTIEPIIDTFYQSALKYFCLLEIPNESENVYESNKNNIFNGDFFSIIDNILKNLPEQNFDQSKKEGNNSENQEECFSQSPFPFPEEIVKLAQELSSEINIPESFYDGNNDSEFGGNPKKIFEKLTSSEGQSVLMNMMEKVSSKLNQKISSGEIDPNKMQNSAQECLEKILKKNDFENVFKNLSPENMQNIFNQKDINVSNLEKSNETKKRLQRKLKKKHIING